MEGFCSVCGSVMPPRHSYCQVCFEKDKGVFRAVKDYIRANPNSNALQVANATGVPVSKITKFIRDGLLTRIDDERRR